MNSQEYLQGLVQGTADFDALVTQLLSANNDSRKVAEDLFQQLKAHPDACLSNLIRGLGTSPSVESRSYCAIILRKIITSKDDLAVWTNASPNVQAAVKNELLRTLGAEPERTVVSKICDTIYELGELLLPDSAWPELLPWLMSALQPAAGAPPRLTESALQILGDLAEGALEALQSELPHLYQLLATHLASSDKSIAVAALTCAGSLISALDQQPAEQRKLQPLVPAMLQVLTSALQGGDEVSARDALELFIELAESNPKFLRPHLEACVNVHLQVSRAEQLEAETRILGAVFLVTLCEARERAPGMMRKLPATIQSLFDTLMHFLLDVDDDPEWHTTEEEEESLGESELAQVGQECLDRLAMALRGKALVPPAAQLLAAWLVDADWRKRHATLVCLAQIAEGCDKVMLEQLEGLVAMCLKGLADPHPRVRWAACQALGQMCSDLGPDLQDRCHAAVVPALMKVMGDFEAARVQAHAARALVNFSEGCEPELLSPYLDTLIGKLQALLQANKRMLQEGALTALASVADAAQTHFMRYYDEVMPRLLHVLLHAQDRSHRLLRAKALECVSLVGMAVGRDKFRGDAAVVLGFMQKLQAGGLDADDPAASYMLQAGGRLCKCLGEEILPQLPWMLPPLLAAASQEPDVKVQAAEEAVEEDDDDDDIERVQVGDKILSIRTSVLEEKATACMMLCCYADELKGGFFPFVQETAPLMVRLLKFYFHEDVRRAAAQCLPSLLRAVAVAVAGGQAQPSVLRELADFCWAPLLAAMKKEPDNEVLAAMAEATGEMAVEAGAGSVQQAWVEQTFALYKELMEASEVRRKQRLDGADDGDGEALDDEDREALAAREEEESALIDAIASATGSFLKVFGDAVLPYVEALMPALAAMLAPARSPEERRIAVCVVDDLLQHSPAGCEKYAAQSLPVLLEAARHADVDLRQCALYGLGIVAAKAPAHFKPHLQQVVQLLVGMLQAPDARTGGNGRATDNAASAIGKIIEHHSDAPEAAQLVVVWLGYLPLRDDRPEAQDVHEQLVRLVEAADQRVAPHMARVAEVLVEVLGAGTRLLERPAVPRAVGVLQQCQGPIAVAVQAAAARLSPEDQQRFQGAMAGQIAD